MIVTMRRVFVAVRQADADRLLDVLRRLGVIHLEPVKPGEAVPDEETVSTIGRLSRAIQLLGPVEPSGSEPTQSPIDVAAEVLQIHRSSAERRSRLEALHRQADQRPAEGGVAFAAPGRFVIRPDAPPRGIDRAVQQRAGEPGRDQCAQLAHALAAAVLQDRQHAPTGLALQRQQAVEVGGVAAQRFLHHRVRTSAQHLLSHRHVQERGRADGDDIRPAGEHRIEIGLHQVGGQVAGLGQRERAGGIAVGQADHRRAGQGQPVHEVRLGDAAAADDGETQSGHGRATLGGSAPPQPARRTTENPPGRRPGGCGHPRSGGVDRGQRCLPAATASRRSWKMRFSSLRDSRRRFSLGLS